MKKTSPRQQLTVIFRALLREYGPQDWWPGDTPFEVMVGAVLTQNTAWSNVEKAIVNIKRARVLSVASFRRLRPGKLAGLIRPSGYYHIGDTPRQSDGLVGRTLPGEPRPDVP
jgi:endonuclease-3 related protein